MKNTDHRLDDNDKNNEESLDDLFQEIWERESRPELRFHISGAGTVVQTQDLHGHRWEVNNFSNTVWEAAIWMHHFFQDERCFPVGWLRGKRVLELGAGTGLVGLTLALLGAEVTMTDLPEALPILEHNTQATFGPPRDDDRHHVRDGDKAEKSCHGGMPLLPAGEVKRPAIRQLRWGDPADAEEVSAVAAARAAVAAAATAAAGGKGPEGQGFDIIVGADVIYNEPTFPALVSTLYDRRLCSDTTVVYLATMLRGGRHEELLRQLNELFHVRALDPTCADDLRARVGDGRAWAGPEWAPGKSPHRERKRGSDPPGDSGNCCQGVADNGNSCQSIVGSGNYCQSIDAMEGTLSGCGGGATKCEANNAREVPPVGTEGRGGEQLCRGLSPTRSAAGKGGKQGQDLLWSYKEDGLGKILAFVARRRGGGTPSTKSPL